MPGRRRFLSHSILSSLLILTSSSVQAGLTMDYVVRRPSEANYYIDFNRDSIPDRIIRYGDPGDVALLGDVDGDTIADFVVYRDGLWFIDFGNDTQPDRVVTFGGSHTTDTPVLGDFNGDGKADLGIYRNDGVWYLDYNVDGIPDAVVPFGGVAGDIPVVGDFNGDGIADLAIYRNGLWYVDFNLDGQADAVYALGGVKGDIPFAADCVRADLNPENDWRAGLGIFRDGEWFMDCDLDGKPDTTFIYGAAGDRPLIAPLNTAASQFVRSGASGNGTQSSPFGSIMSAVRAAAPGDTIRIAAGNYAEQVTFSRLHDLTFLGAGMNATNLGGAVDSVFEPVLSQNIAVRSLHVSSTSNRGMVLRSSNVTVDRVSTSGNQNKSVLVADTDGAQPVVLIEHSKINQSNTDNGLELQQDSDVTVRFSAIDKNGNAGVVMFNTSSLFLDQSSISRNHTGGLLATNSSSTTIRSSTIEQNGQNGLYFDQSSGADIGGSVFNLNGASGTRGATTGFNGIEVSSSWTGSGMSIHENTLSGNTTNGVFIGSGGVTVANNFFDNNFLGMTIDPLQAATNIQVRGNLIQVPLTGQNHEEGVFINGRVTVTMGGAGTDANRFYNYQQGPALHCNGSGVTTICSSGWNTFNQCTLPVENCSCPSS